MNSLCIEDRKQLQTFKTPQARIACAEVIKDLNKLI
jgi:hypothetical protein